MARNAYAIMRIVDNDAEFEPEQSAPVDEAMLVDESEDIDQADRKSVV